MAEDRRQYNTANTDGSNSQERMSKRTERYKRRYLRAYREEEKKRNCSEML